MTNNQSNIIYLATNNAHKVEEFSSLAGGALKFVTTNDLIKSTGKNISWDETGKTFAANAKIKAEVLSQLTDAPVLADDSGLMVDALGGDPGVYSSSYGGIEGDSLRNMNKLIDTLKKLPSQRFPAKFVCCLWYRQGQNITKTFTGECHGEIILTPRGANGFGYDPIFLVERANKTLAELTMEEKNRVSHRRQAFTKWLDWWKSK
jgi:XTP/dITP diphosphohydrolase